jgi:hypothetical protein
MVDVRIKLSALWVSLMLSYLLGDVLRIFSGDFEAAAATMEQISGGFYLGMAALFAIPIVMVFLSLTLGYKANRWANITLAAVFFVINIIGLPTYPSLYDRFLNVVGLVFNLLTIRFAWTWRSTDG